MDCDESTLKSIEDKLESEYYLRYCYISEVVMTNPDIEDPEKMRSYIRSFAPLIANAIDATDQVPKAIKSIFNNITVTSTTRECGDHHAVDYGQSIPVTILNMLAARFLAENTDWLRRQLLTS